MTRPYITVKIPVELI